MRPPARVVIVEDHELLATALALALREQGFEVGIVTGPNADEVVTTVRRMAPVLVLLDLELGPVLGSGIHLIGPLIEAGGRVVMMTGVAEAARLGECVEAGAAAVVSKTAGFSDLVAAVRRAADGDEVMSDGQRQALLGALWACRRADHGRLAPFEVLSRREQAVLSGLVEGETAETIASHSHVSVATVRSQIRAILLKLGVTSQLAAVALARKAGWPPGAG